MTALKTYGAYTTDTGGRYASNNNIANLPVTGTMNFARNSGTNACASAITYADFEELGSTTSSTSGGTVYTPNSQEAPLPR